MKSTRKARETRSIVIGDDLFSPWHTIMKPRFSSFTIIWYMLAGYPDDFVPRAPKQPGLRLRELSATNIPEEPGLYELRLSDPFYNGNLVVYIGHTKRNLFNRISQYCCNGSHKGYWINRLLRAGFSIEMRYRKVLPRDLGEAEHEGGKEYPDWDRYRNAEELESVYLKNYDYMLNVSDNCGSRIELFDFLKHRNRVYVPRSINVTREVVRLKDIESDLFRKNGFCTLLLCSFLLLSLHCIGLIPYGYTQWHFGLIFIFLLYCLCVCGQRLQTSG